MIVILEDNVYKIADIVDHFHADWANKTVVITAYMLEAQRLVGENVIEKLFLDYDLPPGAGNGIDYLRTLSKERVRKVYITTKSLDVGREMYKICKEKGIDCERF